MDKELGSVLQFTQDGLSKRKRDDAKADNLSRKWDQLRKSWQTLPIDVCKTEHDNLIKIIRTMITHLGDTSNLILDPDLDSFYLVDVSLVALPQAQERISTLISLYNAIVKNDAKQEENNIAMTAQLTLFSQSDIDRIFASIETSMNEDNNFYGKSESLHKNLPAPTEKLPCLDMAAMLLLRPTEPRDMVPLMLLRPCVVWGDCVGVFSGRLFDSGGLPFLLLAGFSFFLFAWLEGSYPSSTAKI